MKVVESLAHMFFKLKKSPVALPEESERSIALEGRRVDYLLVRRRGRRGVGLKIDGTGMTVAASLTTPIGSIEDMIGKNAGWVLKKLGEWAHRRVQPQRWETGATVYFMGEALTLMIDAGATRVSVEHALSHLFVRLPVGNAGAIEKAALAWYKRQALPHLAQRAFFFSRLHGMTPPRVFLSSANSRWGQLQFAARGAFFLAPHQGAAGAD